MVRKWQLAVFEGWAHLIVMQNFGRDKIDAFMEELLAERTQLDDAATYGLAATS